ncbi:MAG TPA: hypothetical protein VMB03_27735 [Bryobacteraceae bacterium]|nr:hypothetical protein [Bryobacteraceae bacterium]
MRRKAAAKPEPQSAKGEEINSAVLTFAQFVTDLRISARSCKSTIMAAIAAPLPERICTVRVSLTLRRTHHGHFFLGNGKPKVWHKNDPVLKGTVYSSSGHARSHYAHGHSCWCNEPEFKSERSLRPSRAF